LPGTGTWGRRTDQSSTWKDKIIFWIFKDLRYRYHFITSTRSRSEVFNSEIFLNAKNYQIRTGTLVLKVHVGTKSLKQWEMSCTLLRLFLALTLTLTVSPLQHYDFNSEEFAKHS
jgi:hypothetical protein